MWEPSRVPQEEQPGLPGCCSALLLYGLSCERLRHRHSSLFGARTVPDLVLISV